MRTKLDDNETMTFDTQRTKINVLTVFKINLDCYSICFFRCYVFVEILSFEYYYK